MKKRVSAYFLIISLFFGLFPHPALANYQNPVTSLVVSCMPGGTGTNVYPVKLHWLRPAISTKTDAAALPEYASAPHPNADAHQNYGIFFRNATKGEAYAASAPFKTISENDALELEDTSDYNLDGGSLYEYKITPYHGHKYSVRMPNGSYVTTDGAAPMDTSVPETKGYLLTDIAVSAKGSGNTLTVTWDNPTLDNGVSVFSGYRIYYILGGSKAGFIPLEAYRTAMIGDPGLSLNGGRLSFSITDDSLEMGKPYAVKVEPLMNGGLARNQSTLTVNNIRYSFTYRSLTTDEYRVNDAYVSPSLTAAPEGLDFVRLTWNNIATSIQNIDHIDIFSANSADLPNNSILNPALLGTLSGTDASRNINYWLAARPSAVMYYQARIYYTDAVTGLMDSMWTDVAVFDPAYSDFTPYKPAIESIMDNGAAPYAMTVTWDAFLRPAYNSQEAAEASAEFGGMYVDKNISYEVYVTDDIQNFDNPAFAHPDFILPASGLAMSSVTMAIGSAKPVYSYDITNFRQADGAGKYTWKPLEDNAVYYVKISATRSRSDGLAGQASAPAMGAHFIPPSGAVLTNPNMISRPPLRIMKDALGADIVTESSVTIQWDIRYYEIYNPADDSWYTQLGADEDGNLLFGKDADGLSSSRAVLLNSAIYTGAASETQAQALIRADLAKLNALIADGHINLEAYPLRLVDLAGCQFEIHTVQYDYMSGAGGYETYMAMLQLPGNEGLWHTIAPAGDPNHPEYEATAEDAPGSGPLLPNTAYVIYFRPYITVNETKTAYYPNYVMATTLSVRGPLNVTPTVPVPEAVSVTDTSVTVRWKYSPELQYDLSWAETLAAYPDKGTVIPWAALSASAAVDGDYMYYTITGLFPETQYQIWIRAGAAQDGGVAYSAWSNPISATTPDLQPPEPPKGLGPASAAHMTAYNKANNVNLSSLAEHYFVVEWMRDILDADDAQTAAPQPANAQNTGASAVSLTIPDVTDMYAAMFSGLVANRTYYVRAKTVLAVTKAAGGGVQAAYSYVVQAADNPDFADAIEISVPMPADISALNPSFAKRMESAWCAVIMVYTAKTDNEYDGMSNPGMYPLPTRDFEITYDGATDTLKYRFRSNEIDATGAHDNQADQRFISRLIADRTFVYTVDMTKYGPAAANYAVEVPCSILRAFTERKIELLLVTEGMSAAFPPGCLETAALKALPGFGKNAKVIFSISSMAGTAPGLRFDEAYAATPQKLAVTVVTQVKILALTQTAAPVTVEITPAKYGRSADGNTVVGNTRAYYRDGNTAGWEAVSSEPGAVSGALHFSTYKLGEYAAITGRPPAGSGFSVNSAVYAAMRDVTAKIKINDMPVFDPGAPVIAGQMNNLTLAATYGMDSVSLRDVMSEADRGSLEKAGLFVADSDSAVSREDAVNALVRLYEIKTKSKISDWPDARESAFPDIWEASRGKAEGMLKAEKAGLYPAGTAYAAPLDAMTWGDLMYMLDAILKDDVKDAGK
ncbi:MAG: fibronectin type III domain-containing protein [Defluviitaleaceae bacterium]|nr:fibronectin type III domain-containing protein [Defluviitaleaceae bacterium]